MGFLFEPYQIIDPQSKYRTYVYSNKYREPIHDAFVEYLNNNWNRVGGVINQTLEEDGEETVDSMDWSTLLKNNYLLKDPLDNIAKEFLENYNGPEPTVWNVGKRDDVRELDGKVLVVSNDDNSIPYDTWDKINSLFNGWNVHLG